MIAPFAVKLKELPLQTVVFPLMLIVGRGLTVIFFEVELLHPLVSVPVTTTVPAMETLAISIVSPLDQE